MSNDLISRKALLKELREIMDEPHNTMFLMGIGAAVSIVEHRETAFDKEKVIEELKEQIELVSYNPMTAGRYIKKDRVIKIVEESERLKGVVEYMNGATFKQVAKNHGVTECAVRYWVKKYAPKVYAQNMQKKKPCIQQEEAKEKRKTKLIFIKCTSNSGYFKRKMV